MQSKYRLLLILLILISLGVTSFAVSQILIYRPDDFIFSSIVLFLLIGFCLWEIILTLIKFKKPLALNKIAYLESGDIHKIPLIAVILGILISLVLAVTGLILYFIKSEEIIRCNSFVILSLGSYLLMNSLFYIIFITTNKRK